VEVSGRLVTTLDHYDISGKVGTST